MYLLLDSIGKAQQSAERRRIEMKSSDVTHHRVVRVILRGAQQKDSVNNNRGCCVGLQTSGK